METIQQKLEQHLVNKGVTCPCCQGQAFEVGPVVAALTMAGRELGLSAKTMHSPSGLRVDLEANSLKLATVTCRNCFHLLTFDALPFEPDPMLVAIADAAASDGAMKRQKAREEAQQPRHYWDPTRTPGLLPSVAHDLKAALYPGIRHDELTQREGESDVAFAVRQTLALEARDAARKASTPEAMRQAKQAAEEDATRAMEGLAEAEKRREAKAPKGVVQSLWDAVRASVSSP